MRHTWLVLKPWDWVVNAKHVQAARYSENTVQKERLEVSGTVTVSLLLTITSTREISQGILELFRF